MVKVYIPQIALVLQASDGSTFRVAAGEAVELTPEQYKQVAAYVVEGEISAADLAEAGEVVIADADNPAEAKAAASTSKRSRSADKE